MTRFALAAASLLFAGFVSSHPAFAQPSAPADQPAHAESAEEREVFQRMNDKRGEHEIASLAWNEALARAAREQAQRCAESGKLTRECHEYGGQLGERMKEAKILFRTVGENMASYPTPEKTVAGWMGSPIHHDNMLNVEVSEGGVGVATHDGLTITCAIFVGPPKIAPPLDAPRR